MEIGTHGIHQTVFCPQIHHCDTGTLRWGCTHKGRTIKDAVDIFGDGIALGDAGAVVKFQHGHGGIRVFRLERIGTVLPTHDIDRDEFHLIRCAFFCQGDANP